MLYLCTILTTILFKCVVSYLNARTINLFMKIKHTIFYTQANQRSGTISGTYFHFFVLVLFSIFYNFNLVCFVYFLF